jgi:phage-related protein
MSKPLFLLTSEIKTPPFSEKARIEAGTLLRRMQDGEKLSMPQCRPVPSIGKGCYEIRILNDNKWFRIIVRIDSDAIIVANVVQKKTNRLSKKDVDTAKRTLKLYDSR